MTIASDCMSEFTKQNLETIGLIEQVSEKIRKVLKASIFGKVEQERTYMTTPNLIEYGLWGNS